MSLRTDVEQLRAEAIAALTAAHDHLTYSQQLWRPLAADARRGRADALVLTNRITGSRVMERDLVEVLWTSLTVFLPSAAIQQLVSATEVFLADLVRLWIAAHPGHLKGTVDVQTIVAAPDKAALLQPLIEQYVVAMAYKSPRDWFKQLNTIVTLGAPAELDVDRFAELKATRDVFVHNRGIANATYLRKAGTLARAAAGQPLDLPDAYVSDAWQLCQRLASDVGTAAAARA